MLVRPDLRPQQHLSFPTDVVLAPFGPTSGRGRLASKVDLAPLPCEVHSLSCGGSLNKVAKNVIPKVPTNKNG